MWAQCPSLAHKLSSCPAVSTFWEEILDVLHAVTDVQLPKKPLLMLFHYAEELSEGDTPIVCRVSARVLLGIVAEKDSS